MMKYCCQSILGTRLGAISRTRNSLGHSQRMMAHNQIAIVRNCHCQLDLIRCHNLEGWRGGGLTKLLLPVRKALSIGLEPSPWGSGGKTPPPTSELVNKTVNFWLKIILQSTNSKCDVSVSDVSPQNQTDSSILNK